MRRATVAWRYGHRAALVLLSALVLSACFSTKVTFDGSTDPSPMATTVLTPDGTDVYDVSRNGSTLDMSAPATNSAGNLREAIWPSDAPAVTNEMSCATWSTQVGSLFDQEGVMLRVAPTDDGLGTRAISVTKNVIYGFVWVFNVHVWDTRHVNGYTLIGQFDLSKTLITGTTIIPFPWHICARVSGSTFQFMVWVGDNPQPSWTDASNVEQLTLPDGWVYPGEAGWYIGHLHPGDDVTYTDLQTSSLTGMWDPPTTSLPDTTTSLPDTTTSIP